MKVSLMIAGLMFGLFIHAQSAPAASAPVPSSAPVRLNHLPQPGAKLKYRLTLGVATHWKISGKKHDEGQAQVEYELTGEPASEGCFARWSVHMHRIEPEQQKNNETETNPDKLFHMMEREAFHASLDAYRFSFCISSEGRYSKLHSERDVPELSPDADSKAVARWMMEGSYEGYILERFLLPLINSVFPLYPSEPATIGTSWRDLSRFQPEDVFGVITEQRTLMLKSIAVSGVTLEVHSIIKPLKEDSEFEGKSSNPPDEGTGTLVINPHTGMVDHGAYTLTQHLTNNLPPGLEKELKDVLTGDYDKTLRIEIERR